jgi:ATP-binding cassette subfamily B multidrug efflux pump
VIGRLEPAPLSSRETLAIFRRALRYAAPLRGRFAVKLGLTALSLVPMLVLPVPIKILIDHVIGDLSIADRIGSYPMLARPFVRMLEGAGYAEILFFTIAAQALLLVAIGQIGSDGGERDRTEAWLASGVDAATATENAANAGFSFSGGLFGLFDFRWTLRLTQDLNHHYRARLFERIQSLPLHLFDDARIGDAVYRLMYDTPSITQTCYRILLVPTLVPFAIAAYAFTIWDSFAEPRLALAALAFAPLAFIATWPFARLLRRQGGRSRAAGAVSTTSLEEGVANILAVQTQGGEGRERARFDRDSARSFAQHRGVMALAMLAILAAFVPGIALVRWVFLEIVDLVIAGSISLGDFSVLFTYFIQIGVFAVMFGSLWFTLQTAAPGLERVFFLMDLEPERDPTPARDLPRAQRSLAFEDVDFAWPDGTPALRGVSFEAKFGQVTAIVGPAGAGKTTLIYHVPRFLRPQRGRVCVDGVDLAGVTRASLRAQIAFIFQESALFDGTLEENLRLANPNASELELRRALAISGADEFVRRFPDGLATRLGRAGAGLSVGQKQRLSIARGLLRDAPILILDEPTSALDPDTERRLLAALREAARERIVLVVAHRLSTVRDADQILFLRDGAIVERGTHDQLIAIPDGAYRRYAELQSAG